MKRYAVYVTDSFDDLCESLSTDEYNWVRKMEMQLVENSYGKMLRTPWLREKRYRNKRLYYVVDESMGRILIVDFRSKKRQQEVINKIVFRKDDLIEYLRSL